MFGWIKTPPTLFPLSRLLRAPSAPDRAAERILEWQAIEIARLAETSPHLLDDIGVCDGSDR